MEKIALKVKIDYERYRVLSYADKLTVQKLLVYENQKLNFRYKHHKHQKGEAEGEVSNDLKKLGLKKSLTVGVAQHMLSNDVGEQLIRITEKEAEVIRKKMAELIQNGLGKEHD